MGADDYHVSVEQARRVNDWRERYKKIEEAAYK